jgi:hypothetical protein
MKRHAGWLWSALTEIGSMLKDVWQTIENSGPCCGIRLDRKPCDHAREMPTPSSCCGVRM